MDLKLKLAFIFSTIATLIIFFMLPYTLEAIEKLDIKEIIITLLISAIPWFMFWFWIAFLMWSGKLPIRA